MAFLESGRNQILSNIRWDIRPKSEPDSVLLYISFPKFFHYVVKCWMSGDVEYVFDLLLHKSL